MCRNLMECWFGIKVTPDEFVTHSGSAPHDKVGLALWFCYLVGFKLLIHFLSFILCHSGRRLHKFTQTLLPTAVALDSWSSSHSC